MDIFTRCVSLRSNSRWPTIASSSYSWNNRFSWSRGYRKHELRLPLRIFWGGELETLNRIETLAISKVRTLSGRTRSDLRVAVSQGD